MRYRATLAALAVWASLGCATAPVSHVEPGQRPDADTDEAGLWMQMDAMERRVRSSGRVVTDPDLNAYVKDIVCRLAHHYCKDIRFYIVQTPHFNATMAANGYMEIWTGLMLRSQNEAQLAFVLGHELGHYTHRHGLQRWRDVRAKTNMAAVFQAATAAAGVGYVGDMGQLAAYASILAFSRDQEREADSIGLEKMVTAGYDPREAPRIWQALLEEQQASNEPRSNVFFATHPSTERRIVVLRDEATKLPSGDGPQLIGTRSYQEAIRPFRSAWLRDEVRRREYAQSLVVLRRLRAGGSDIGEFLFFEGEVYRMRDQEGDLRRAIEFYTRALSETDAPAETYRSMGIVYRRMGQPESARSAFSEYLAKVPDAPDKTVIESYLSNQVKVQ